MWAYIEYYVSYVVFVVFMYKLEVTLLCWCELDMNMYKCVEGKRVSRCDCVTTSPWVAYKL